MGISKTQYCDIMFEYDQTRMKNKRILDARYEELYKKFPELKAIHDELVELSIEQARMEILNPTTADETRRKYIENKDRLIARKAQILKENHFPEDYLKPIFRCKTCKDTGYIDNKPCHCFNQAKLQLLYESSNIKDILESENFEHFREDYYSDSEINENLSITPRENIRKVKAICLDYIEHFQTDYKNFLFYGGTGVGKTFLTHCIAKELLDRGNTVVYLTSLQLFDILEKNKFYREEISSSDMQLDYIFHCDLLIIDDLGTELSNSLTASQLYSCIEERAVNKRSTIISTNLSFSDIEARYSQRILSRFISYYDFKQIIGNDIRIQKAIKNI